MCEKIKSNKKILSWICGILGVVWGVGLFLFALGLAGAGHGWGSAVAFGFLAIFTTPLCVLVTIRRNEIHRGTVKLFFNLLILLDILLIVSVFSEGYRYFMKVYPGSLIWVVVWFAPQIIFFILQKRKVL